MVDAGKSAKIVDHAVRQIGEKYSSAEKGLANAVLRKVAARMPERFSAQAKDEDEAAIRYSHPRWLIKRWSEQFGFEAAVSMAKWNQEEPELFMLPLKETPGAEMGVESPWSPYRNAKGLNWTEVSELLDEGAVYIQNPGARIAPGLLVGNFTGGRILDLCAAPGGKSVYLNRALGDELSEIVAVDLPGPRFERLLANVSDFGSEKIQPLDRDLFELDAAKLGKFEAVLLDAPCSNTGVLQRKPDAKWRLAENGFAELATLQGRMLAKASEFVNPGCIFIHSTCSIDADENAEVVDHFLESPEGESFELVESVLSLPWETGHDGSGAFLLRRKL